MPTNGCNATRKPISSVNRLVTFQESCTNQSMLIDVPAGRVRAWDSLYCVKLPRRPFANGCRASFGLLVSTLKLKLPVGVVPNPLPMVTRSFPA